MANNRDQYPTDFTTYFEFMDICDSLCLSPSGKKNICNWAAHFSDDQLRMKNANDWSVAHQLALIRSLPKKLYVRKEILCISDKVGNTVAHVAARSKAFPVEFATEEMLSIISLQGRTVAHEMAKNGILHSVPEPQKEWLQKKDKNGITIAHEMVRGHCFPSSFEADEKILCLADKDGWTVAHQFGALGKLPEQCFRSSKILGLKTNEGYSVAETCVSNILASRQWNLVTVEFLEQGMSVHSTLLQRVISKLSKLPKEECSVSLAEIPLDSLRFLLLILEDSPLKTGIEELFAKEKDMENSVFETDETKNTDHNMPLSNEDLYGTYREIERSVERSDR